MASHQALSTGGGPMFRLFDSQELLSMDSKVASGYIVLMGGYPVRKSKRRSKRNRDRDDDDDDLPETTAPPKLDRGAINLAFMALTDGNVVEACFGAKSFGTTTDADANNPAMKLATEAKNMLSEAVRSSEAVKEIAVKAYGQAFQIVLQYNEDIKALNFISRCYKVKPTRDAADASLTEAFRELNEAIDAAN